MVNIRYDNRFASAYETVHSVSLANPMRRCAEIDNASATEFKPRQKLEPGSDS